MAYTADSVRRYLKKNAFDSEDIVYIQRKDGATQLHLVDRRVLNSKIPLGHFQDYFPKDDFQRINKDALIRNKQVVRVKNRIYLLADGTTLEGRHHGSKSHTEFVQQLLENQSYRNSDAFLAGLRKKFEPYDALPIPFCVMQLVMDKRCRRSGFVYRYCNPMMEVLEENTADQLLDKPLPGEHFSMDEEHLLQYSAVAKNGGFRVFREKSRLNGQRMAVICYQVETDFCACAVLEEKWFDILDKMDGKIPGLA